ncbi:MAG: SDR family oxidoreductase [Rhodospirillaceae bacterium]|jgi:3-oxoacyl-[acyl-carrier protein] reductase|nr:SDR family oxidoreductase [Rhodospirillaceae bacterium]MBT3492734.1 SDR family oxidoreductase [Rhodospirillaceae bacterium]MBT3779571.1 SDR family oxidoreductase [Rhodospirillaceae bacterium]MBT3975864.1 SDR family oxidoreductase [Rhodospirillaceae bacterium]MBT4168344.1 SDR family oxidoreductase [Rhodospirillaceae bacterium]
MGTLDGRVAIVTGSGRGIGREVALQLAELGAKVVVNDLDAGPADEVVAEIKAAGGEAVACAGSVTEAGFAQRFVGTAIDTYGDLHIIINNAGYTWDAVIQKMTEEQFDAMIDVHLKAPWRILKEAAEFIRVKSKGEAQEGNLIVRKVVNISSISGTRGNAGQTNYSSAKAAVVGLSKTLAKEWGRYNVAVNSVAFGFVETRLTEATDQKKIIEIEGKEIPVGVPVQNVAAAMTMIPMGRAGTPREAAGAVVALCLPQSDYISGQLIEVTGGL